VGNRGASSHGCPNLAALVRAQRRELESALCSLCANNFCRNHLIGAGLLIKTFSRIASEPLGFHTRDVFVAPVTLPYRSYSNVGAEVHFSENALERLRMIPSVRAAGVGRAAPFQVNGLTHIEMEGDRHVSVEQMPEAAEFVVGPGYFDALGVPLLRGRKTIDDRERQNSPPVAVINDEMARRMFPRRRSDRQIYTHPLHRRETAE
jgi:putative ABC transport system permease protein